MDRKINIIVAITLFLFCCEKPIEYSTVLFYADRPDKEAQIFIDGDYKGELKYCPIMPNCNDSKFCRLTFEKGAYEVKFIHNTSGHGTIENVAFDKECKTYSP